jgi:hypothetical protein
MRDERGMPVLESRAARLALVVICILIFGASIVQVLPRPEEIPAYIRYLPIEIPLRVLFGFD